MIQPARHGLIPTLCLMLFIGPAFSEDAPAYVGSEACIDRHEDAAEVWMSSHHARDWTMPSPVTVAADFDGTMFKHDRMIARFRIEGDAYHVAVTETDGGTTDYRVHSVAGIAPLQQYLFETAPGQLQSFDVG